MRCRRASRSSARCSGRTSTSREAASTSSRSARRSRLCPWSIRPSPRRSRRWRISIAQTCCRSSTTPSARCSSVIDTAAPLTHTATEVLPTALTMLGDHGPRTYLVLFQNNAEIRATGGAAAAAVYVRAEGGASTLRGRPARRRSSPDRWRRSRLWSCRRDAGAVRPTSSRIFSQNYTRPRTSRRPRDCSSKIAAKTGFAVDGVVSLDPVVLGRHPLGDRSGHRRRHRDHRRQCRQDPAQRHILRGSPADQASGGRVLRGDFGHRLPEAGHQATGT